MTSAVRFSAGYARLCAMRGALWTPLDRDLLLRAGVEPDGRSLSGSPDAVFPPLMRWYVTVARMLPAARALVTALFRLHEIENVKLLWRAAQRGRAPLAACWRPLEPMASVRFEPAPLQPDELVQRLSRTPYGEIAHALRRSHAVDLPAAEMGLDRWAWSALNETAHDLPRRESVARALVRLLIVEHDLDVLRRGTAFGLDADLVAKATVVLSQEHGSRGLAPAAAWTPAAGALSSVLTPRLARELRGAATWDDAIRAIRRARVRGCRRAFVGWPFELGPPIAALLQREAQARAAMSLAAARHAGRSADAALPLALSASLLEA